MMPPDWNRFRMEDTPLLKSDGMHMNVYGNKGAVHDVSFVPDSKYFLSVSSDNYMRAYSLDTYNCCARFHPKITYIGTGSYDKAVRLWSITDGASVRVFSDHVSPVLSIAFSPCGKYLASGGEDGLVLTHELTTGRVISRFHLQEHEPVTSLVWSVTGETLVTGSLTGTVQFYGWPSASKIGIGVYPRCAAQPVGFEAATLAANSRVRTLREMHEIVGPVVVVESFIVEIRPDKWYEANLIVLDDDLKECNLETYSQMIPVPSGIVEENPLISKCV
ncbi:transcription initiation factor TFIID subunit 5-like [Diaphorina citri]|uniref:Transcription initiation factor TFIID subunit 5-like n=1 Tax=Diaphorina citri TaxID=121845 RepID=A0A3Q0J9B4_DIACI|nr:transcription initiation factor TFIID subunit 5-like [Diaphorina citri]